MELYDSTSGIRFLVKLIFFCLDAQRVLFFFGVDKVFSILYNIETFLVNNMLRKIC